MFYLNVNFLQNADDMDEKIIYNRNIWRTHQILRWQKTRDIGLVNNNLKKCIFLVQISKNEYSNEDYLMEIPKTVKLHNMDWYTVFLPNFD